MPIMTSLSTRFLGQPRLTNPTFVGGDSGGSGLATGNDFDDMQFFHFSILVTFDRNQTISDESARTWDELHVRYPQVIHFRGFDTYRFGN